ncbi:MAG: thioesterase family protein [Myxococcales bacterium]|jgi:acyl-CoA thioester hydrolase
MRLPGAASREYKAAMAQPEPTTPAEFRLELDVADDDLDELGHVNNAVYVRWLQDVAWAHSRAVGFGLPEYTALGGVFVVRRHEIEYLLPAGKGDRVQLITHVAWWKGATCERHTQVRRASDGALLARARTLWAYVSLDGGRPRRIPKPVLEAFSVA